MFVVLILDLFLLWAKCVFSYRVLTTMHIERRAYLCCMFPFLPESFFVVGMVVCVESPGAALPLLKVEHPTGHARVVSPELHSLVKARVTRVGYVLYVLVGCS